MPEQGTGAITLANLSTLGDLLDQLAATGNIRSGMPILSAEFGYETTPQDPFAKVSEQQQADYLAIAEALTYFNPRVVGHTQFLLRDSGPDKRYKKGSKPYFGTYQSGLLTQNGRSKPAADSYSFPFLAFRNGEQTSLFGMVRFAPNGAFGQPAGSVQLEFKPASGESGWSPYGEPILTDSLGYFVSSVPSPPPGQLRVLWQPEGSPFPVYSTERGV